MKQEFFNAMPDGTCRTIKANQAKVSAANLATQTARGATGVFVYDAEGITGALNVAKATVPNVAIRAVITPDREEKRQNGRRMKNEGEPMFTLTAQDRHGVAIAYDEQNNTLRTDGTVGTLTTDGSSPKHNNRVIVGGGAA